MRPSLRLHLKALAILDQVSGSTPTHLLQHLVTEPVAVQDLSIATSDGSVRARLYIPVRHPDAPALVLIHGVHHLGIDEPRLIAFARALSSCGVRVLTPELPDLKDYRIDPNSVRTIGQSVQWFARSTGHPVGVMGLSFAGGLSLVADADPRFHPAFKFVFAVGSQNSMARIATYYRTGKDPRPDGSVDSLPAHEYGPLVLEYDHLEDFLPPRDLRLVREALRAHLYEDSKTEAAAIGHLSNSQQGEYSRLLATNSPETRHLIELSSSKHLAEMKQLSPAGHLAHLATPVYLLHGSGDNIIPSAESLWMAQDLAPEDLQAVLVSPILSHLDLHSGSNPGLRSMLLDLRERWHLVHFFARILYAAASPTGRG